MPAELIAIVDKLLQVEPSARYQSAAELAQELNVIDEKINHKKNWWQQQHWLMKIVIAMPLMVILAWSIRSVLFPPSTQELIARQLLESKKIAFLPCLVFLQFCASKEALITQSLPWKRFTAFQRRSSCLKRRSITPVRDHVLNPNFSFL